MVTIDSSIVLMNYISYDFVLKFNIPATIHTYIYTFDYCDNFRPTCNNRCFMKKGLHKLCM